MTCDCDVNDIYKINSDVSKMPPRCFECCLAQVQPSAMRTISNNWDIEVIKLIRECTIDDPNAKDIMIDVSFFF